MKKYCIILLISPLMVYGQSDSLNHYLKIAAENNPAVKAAFLAYEASLQKIRQMGAYENPQLEIGFFLEPMEWVGGREIAQFQLMQMFPWFGTQKASRTEAQHMAKMEFEQFRETRDNLFLEVYTQWFKLYRLQQQWKNNRENKKLLLQIEALALKKFASGNSDKGTGSSIRAASETPTALSQTSSPSMGMAGMSSVNSGMDNMPASASNTMPSMGSSSAGGKLSDILRIQLEIMETDNNAENLLSEIRAEKVKFNALLNRPANNDILVPEVLQPVVFSFDISSALTQMADQNPVLGMLQQEEMVYKAHAEMAGKMSYPMFGIGLQYMLIGKMPESNSMVSMNDGANAGVNNSMNGKDMIMPMLSVTIPIYRNKYKAEQKEIKFQRLANREKQIDIFNQLKTNLLQFKSRLDNALRNITLYQKQTELASSAYDLVALEFTSGKSDLSNVIQVQRQLLDYQLKTSEAIADYNTMAANIQKILSSYESKE